MPNAYNELARRIMAAIISYTGGLASVDRTLKQYVPPVVNFTWCQEAQRLQVKLMKDMDDYRRMQKLSL